MSIQLELVDNDYVVRAKTDLPVNGKEDLFGRFLKEISKELLPGETAYLSVGGSDADPVRFQISYSE